MSAATLTAAGALSATLAAERDPWRRALSLISSIEILAEAFDSYEDGDEHYALLNFAAELRGQLFDDAQAVLDRNEDEREADRFGGFAEVLRMWNEHLRKERERAQRLRLQTPREFVGIESKVLEPMPALLAEQCE